MFEQKKINKTKFTFQTGDITQIPADYLILWTTPNLISGDETFIKIHKAAGTVVKNQCMHAVEYYGVGDKYGKTIPVSNCVYTKGGMLPIYNIIHSVLPNHRIKSEDENKQLHLISSIKMARELINALGETGTDVNPQHVLICPIPEVIYGEVTKKDLRAFYEQLLNVDYKKVSFVFETEQEGNFYFDEFYNYTTPLYERILNKIFKNKRK